MFVYGVTPGVVQTTSGTPNTVTNGMTLNRSGTGRPARMMGLYIHGRGAGLTAISGLLFRVAAGGGVSAPSGGTGITSSPRDPGAQAAKWSPQYGATANFGNGSLVLAIGCGAAGASGWFSQSNNSDIVQEDVGGLNLAIIVNVLAGLASLSYEESLEYME